MSITNNILKFVTDPGSKTIVEIGAHEDTETLELAKHFKHVYSYYEYLKIREKEEARTNDKFEDDVSSKEEIIDFFRFMLPDHWKYGEKDFLNQVKSINYPFKLWEGYDLFWIKRL